MYNGNKKATILDNKLINILHYSNYKLTNNNLLPWWLIRCLQCYLIDCCFVCEIKRRALITVVHQIRCIKREASHKRTRQREVLFTKNKHFNIFSFKKNREFKRMADYTRFLTLLGLNISLSFQNKIMPFSK